MKRNWYSLVIVTVCLPLYVKCANQQLNEWHDLLCPGSQLPLRDALGLPVSCLPAQDQCPPKSICWFSGFDYMCCPMDYTQGLPISPTQFKSLVEAAAKKGQPTDPFQNDSLVQAPPSNAPSDFVFGSWEGAAEALDTYGALSLEELDGTDLVDTGSPSQAYDDYASASYVDFGNFGDLLPPPPPEENSAEVTTTIPVILPDTDTKQTEEPITQIQNFETKQNLLVDATEFKRIGGDRDTELKPTTNLKKLLEKRSNESHDKAEYDYDDESHSPMNQFPAIIMEIEIEEPNDSAGNTPKTAKHAPLPSPIYLSEVSSIDNEENKLNSKIEVQGSGYKAPKTPEAFQDVPPPFNSAGSLLATRLHNTYNNPSENNLIASNPTSPSTFPMSPSIKPDPLADNLYKFRENTISPPNSLKTPHLFEPISEPEPINRLLDNGRMGIMDPPVMESLLDMKETPIWFAPKKGVTVASIQTTTAATTEKPKPAPKKNGSVQYSGLDLATVLKLAKPVANTNRVKTIKVTHPRLRPFDKHGQQRVWKPATTERPTSVLFNPTMLKMAEHVAQFMSQQKEDKSRGDREDKSRDKVSTALSKLEDILREAYKNVTKTLLKAARVDDTEEIIDPDLFLQTFRSVFDQSQELEEADNLIKSLPEPEAQQKAETSNDTPFIPAIPADFDKFFPLIAESQKFEEVTNFQPKLPIFSASIEEPVDNWIKLPSSSVSLRSISEEHEKEQENEQNMSLEDIVKMRRFLKENDIERSGEIVTWAPVPILETTPEPIIITTTVTEKPRVIKTTRRRIKVQKSTLRPRTRPQPKTTQIPTLTSVEPTPSPQPKTSPGISTVAKIQTPFEAVTRKFTPDPSRNSIDLGSHKFAVNVEEHIIDVPDFQTQRPEQVLNVLENSLDRSQHSFNVIQSRRPNIILDLQGNSLHSKEEPSAPQKSAEPTTSKPVDDSNNEFEDSIQSIKSRLNSSPLIPANPLNSVASNHPSKTQPTTTTEPESIYRSREYDRIESDPAPRYPSIPGFTATEALNTIDEGTIYIAAPGRRSQQHLAYLIDQGWPYNPLFHRPPEYRPAPRLYGLFQAPPRSEGYDDPPPPEEPVYNPDSRNNHNHEYQRWLSRYRGTRNG